MLQTLRAPIYLPRANTDPVSSPHAALAVFSLALRRPLCDEILVLMLDNQLRGIGLMSFDAVASISNNIITPLVCARLCSMQLRSASALLSLIRSVAATI